MYKYICNQINCVNLKVHEKSLKEKLKEFDLNMDYEGAMITA